MGGKRESDGIAPIYLRALDLRNAGASNEAIAVVVGVGIEALPALLDLAVRKQTSRQERTKFEASEVDEE